MNSDIYRERQVRNMNKIAHKLGRGVVRVSHGGCVHLLIDGGSLVQFGKTHNYRFFEPAFSSVQEKTTLQHIGEVWNFFFFFF